MKPTSDTSARGHHAFFIALGAIVLLLALAPRGVFAALVYDRHAILRGQAWRVLTGNLVHGSATHLGLNLAGVALVWIAFGRRLSCRRWLGAALTTGAAVGLGVLLLDPRVPAMAGLSGLLHGLLAAGALAAVRAGEPMGWLFVALLALKVGGEQLAGPLAPTGAALGMPIAWSAHVYGSLSGALAGAALWRSPERAES